MVDYINYIHFVVISTCFWNNNFFINISVDLQCMINSVSTSIEHIQFSDVYFKLIDGFVKGYN